jgi:uncharacterized protein
MLSGRMMNIGKVNRLMVSELQGNTALLDAGDLGLLPVDQKTRRLREGAFVEAFIQRERDGSVSASLEIPYVQAEEFAVLEVTDTHPDLGAFLDWGLRKELLLPSREMEFPVEPGDRVVVYIYVDPSNERLFATTRITPYLSASPPTFPVGSPVEIFVIRETPLGYVALVERSHLGLVYHSSIKEPLACGERIRAYIGAIRPDGKIDLTLDSSGAHRVNSLTEEILAALQRNEGKLSCDDDSSPEVIRQAFGASKKAFKQALGSLYKQRLIEFTRPGIQLIRDMSKKPRF